MKIRLLTVLAIASLAACKGNAPPAAESSQPDRQPTPGAGIVAGDLEVSVDRANKTLALRNTTEKVVGYFVIEKNMAVVAMFPPCGDNCTRIVQGATDTVAFKDIAGYTPQAREASVLWFTYERQADGSLRPQGSMHSVQVQLD